MEPYRSFWVLSTILLLVTSCTSTKEWHTQVMHSDESEDLVAFVWEWEITDSEDRVITEEEIGRDIDRGLKKWSHDWRIPAMKASQLVRAGQPEEAAEFHARAREIYYQDPYWGEPLDSAWNSVGTALLAGPLITAIGQAATDDVVREMPPEPSETTWLPIYIWGSRVIYKKDAPEPAQPTEPGMVKQLNAPAAVVATPPTTVERRLGDLDDLKRRGVISEAEHEAQRNRILEDL